MGARISSMLRKAASQKTERKREVNYALLAGDPEWELIKVLASYNDTLVTAADNLDPSLVGSYLYNLSKAFSRFYHDCPILQAESELADARLALCEAVLRVLKDALSLVCIPFLETM
jgi:arginyl-tRNA synthetase